MRDATVWPGTRRENKIRIIEYPSGRVVRLYESLRVKSTFPNATNPEETGKARAGREPPDCARIGEKLLRHDTVLGHKVAVVYGFHDTHWRAPDLGCEDLEYKIESRLPRGALKVTTLEKPVRLKLGEPDPRLFSGGADYKELKPSAILRLAAAKAGMAWNDRLEREGAESDNQYFAERLLPPGDLPRH